MFNFNAMRGFRGGSPMQQQASNPFMRLAAGINPGGGMTDPNVQGTADIQGGPASDFAPGAKWGGPNQTMPLQISGPGGAPLPPQGGLAGAVGGQSTGGQPPQDMIQRLLAMLQQGGSMGGSSAGAAMPPAPAMQAQMPGMRTIQPQPMPAPVNASAGGIPQGGIDLGSIMSNFGLNR